MAGRSAEGGEGERSAEGAGGGGDGVGGGGLGTHCKPPDTTRKPEPRAARWGQWQRPEPRPARWDNGRGVKAVSGGGSEGDGGDDVEWLWAKC